MGFKEKTYELTAKTVIANLAKRNMEGFYCADSKEAVECALSLMEKGAAVAWGGSESVKECGLMEAVKNGDYELIDRSAALTPQEQRALFARTAMSDYYLMGTNAITLDGELVNIDGNGNRLPCAVTGVCADCLADECFCNQIVVTRRSGHTGRIKVILVGETLGY